MIEARFREALGLQKAGRLADAESIWRSLVVQAPTVAMVHHNLVALLRAQGRHADAETVLWSAHSRLPGDPEITHALAITLLAAGDYARGWPLWESRRAIQGTQSSAPPFSFPEWRGQPSGSLLVWYEQGFGDQIQFARYVPHLRALGINVTLACRPPLARLFEGLADHLIVAEGEVRIPRRDAWTLIQSLPGLCGTTLETIPDGVIFPATSAERASGRVGVVTRGSPDHRNDARRSLPQDQADRLLSLPGALSLMPEHTGARDFADTAALIRNVDLVITVDTSVAHLAGAMGKAVWILLPALDTDWRWLRDREDSPWYRTARLFRQARGEPWSAVVDRVGRTLERGRGV